MSSSRVVLVGLIALTVSACSASPAAQGPSDGVVHLVPVTPTPVAVAEPSTAPQTISPTPEPTISPTPKRARGPVPPKPRGIEIDTPCLLDCRAGDLAGYRLTWKAPRTKGVEIRVYGITKCFRTNDPEGDCLRVHTRLPDDIKVLLAKGPASKGVLDLDIAGLGDGDQAEEWCTYFDQTEDGTRFYSIVVAAYNANGPSVFAIADPGRYSAGECQFDTI